jgi:hypothetical protein
MAHSPLRVFAHSRPHNYSLDELVLMPMSELVMLCIRWRLQTLSPRADSQQKQAHAQVYEELHQNALLSFLAVAWRRPSEAERTAACRDERLLEISRSLLLTAVNKALYYAGFEEPFAFKSAVWRQAVIDHLDKLRIYSGPRCFTSGAAQQSRKSCKPLLLVDLRTPAVISRFITRMRSNLIVSIQEIMGQQGLSLAETPCPVVVVVALPEMSRKRSADQQDETNSIEQQAIAAQQVMAVAQPCYWCDNNDVFSTRRRQDYAQFDVTDYCGDDMLPRGTLVCSPECIYWSVRQLWGEGQALNGLYVKLCEEYRLSSIAVVPRRV